MGGHTRSNLKRMARVEKINRYYDLEIRNLERTSRELLLDTSKGKLKLGPSEHEEGFLNFLLSAQQHLVAKGFTEFAAIHPSRESIPFIKYHGQVMVLEDQTDGEEFTYTRENIARGMETLARFHTAARGIDPLPGSKFKITWGKWPDRCFKEVNDLVRQKILLKDRRVSGFDAKFAEHVDRLIERGLMAWQRFNHETYRKMLREEMDARAFNLHNFKAGNLKIQNGRVLIADMSRIRFEVQIYDLAYFLDEILENSDLPVQEVAELTAYYSRIRPWTAEEHEALIAFLLYPKGLFRLIRHYYRNRRVKNAEVRFDNLWRLLEREEELVQCLNAVDDEEPGTTEERSEEQAGYVHRLEDVGFASDFNSSQGEAEAVEPVSEPAVLLDRVPDVEQGTDSPEASIRRLREVMGELLSSILTPNQSTNQSSPDLFARVQSAVGEKPATDEVVADVADTYLQAHRVARSSENSGDGHSETIPKAPVEVTSGTDDAMEARAEVTLDADAAMTTCAEVTPGTDDVVATCSEVTLDAENVANACAGMARDTDDTLVSHVKCDTLQHTVSADWADKSEDEE